MKLKLYNLCCARSGDKGENSNVGLVFYHKEIYIWAKDNLGGYPWTGGTCF